MVDGVLHPAIEKAPDPVQVFRLAPSQELKQLDQHVTINDRRFRATTVRYEDTSDAKIALFGDSFVYGFGVGDDETMAVHLQHLLRSRTGTPWQALNFGTGGYNSAQVQRTMEQRLAEHSFSLAVYLYFPNDPELWWREGNPILWECSTLFDDSSLIMRALVRSRLVEAASRGFAHWHLARRGQDPGYWRLIHRPWFPGWWVTERSIRRMREFSARREISLLVVFLPFQSEPLPSAQHQAVVGRVREACHLSGTEFLDLSGLFVAEQEGPRSESLWTKVGPPHYSDAGNLLLATALFKHLSRLGWVAGVRPNRKS
ncbi:MAG: hypothetical protein GY835_23270 [bacterium]|nr:hypothetical protein [bacterium]